jgi:DNA topoisomerase VI subunit B
MNLHNSPDGVKQQLVNGQPRPAPKLVRETFEFSRAGEYFDIRELQTMTGQPAERFPDVVFKESLDNAADAVEKGAQPGVTPKVGVRLVRRGRLIYILVRDNGSGFPPEAVEKVLNFQTRASDKSAYRSPTRGMQGNAWKTILGIPWALGVRAPVYIESKGVRHRIKAWLDPAGQVRVEHDTQQVPEKPGTLVAIPLPASRCEHTSFARWVRAFSLSNPHLAVRIRNFAAAGKHW